MTCLSSGLSLTLLQKLWFLSGRPEYVAVWVLLWLGLPFNARDPGREHGVSSLSPTDYVIHFTFLFI
jgi:hypothetical protein